MAKQSHTSDEVSVRRDVEPKRVLHTSPDTLAEVPATFITRYPTARAATEIMAMAASPLIFLFCPVQSSRIAAAMVIGNTK